MVGEAATAQLIYLAITSRLLDKPVSVGVKGHSSSGKSFVVEATVKFFPLSAVATFTGMSQRALVYSKEEYRHRTIVIYELTALREGVEDDLTAYFVRSLLSEGRLKYEVTIRTKEEGFVTKSIVKEGPTGLIFTTTKDRIHGENETRVLSVTSDDSRAQTSRVLAQLATEADAEIDLRPWQELQDWLQTAEHRVTIPYAGTLAAMVPPVAVRLRRDFGAVLGLVRAHAILHQATRDRDEQGRIIATLDDYRAVREVVAPLVAEGVGGTVSAVTRETVEAVVRLSAANPQGVRALGVAAELGLDKSAATRRLAVAARGGWVLNQEDRRGRPGRWIRGEPLPDEVVILPTAERLRTVVEGDTSPAGADPNTAGPSGCTVARLHQGVYAPPAPSDALAGSINSEVYSPLNGTATAQPPGTDRHGPDLDPAAVARLRAIAEINERAAR